MYFANLAPTPGLTKKLVVPYLGPARVIQISADGLNYTLKYKNPYGKTREFVRHVSQLKACTQRVPDPPTSPATSVTTTATTSNVLHLANDAKMTTPRVCEPVLQEVLIKMTTCLLDIFAAGKYQRSQHAKSTEPRKTPGTIPVSPRIPLQTPSQQRCSPDDREEL